MVCASPPAAFGNMPNPGTPTTIQQRPLDPYRALPIVRDVSRDIIHVTAAAISARAEYVPVGGVGSGGTDLNVMITDLVDGDLRSQMLGDGRNAPPGTNGGSKKRRRGKQDIPTPLIGIVDTYEQDAPATYVLPTSFVRHRRWSQENLSRIEYNLDAEDEAWLRSHPSYNIELEGESRPQLTFRLLERMIDLLERDTGFDMVVTLEQAERLFARRLNFAKRPSVVSDVYDHWIQKRCRLKRPLLRRFWPVTACNDTNPHLVFRPREKEKYKLRKKRQNDLDALHKLRRLKKDFTRLKTMCNFVSHRETLQKFSLDLGEDIFEQQIYDCVDTSGLPKQTHRTCTKTLEDLFVLPNVDDVAANVDSQGKKGKKRRREGGDTEKNGAAEGGVEEAVRQEKAQPPVPLFIDHLPTREVYCMDWSTSVPHIPTYVCDKYESNEVSLESNYKYKYRGRIGRGGRLCIDRIPFRVSVKNSSTAPPIYYITKNDVPRKNSTGASQLLVPPITSSALRTKIAEIGAAWSDDDEEELVKVGEWAASDDRPRWGEERLAIGPI